MAARLRINSDPMSNTQSSGRTLMGMSDRTIWTAQELLKLTPAEQDAIFDASIVRDLEHAPTELVARARARIEQRIARTESATR